MAEYIEREALKNNLHFTKEGIFYHNGKAYMDLNIVDKIVLETPTADVAEVVRCKDCAKKVDYKGRVMCSKNSRVICGELCGLTATSNEHFCSYGERRDT